MLTLVSARVFRKELQHDRRILNKGAPKILTIAVRILISIAIFIIVIFAVVWLLEDTLYFSLFIGIPAGIISAAVAFVIMTGYQKKR